MALCVTAHDGCFGWFIGTSLCKSTLRAFSVPLCTGKCSEVRLLMEKNRGNLLHSRYPSSKPIQLERIVSNGQQEDSHRGGRPGCTQEHAHTSPRSPLRHVLRGGCDLLYG